VTSCARLPTVSGSPGDDACIQGRPRRTSCPVRACSTGPLETLAPLASAADAPSRSVGLVSFRRSRRPLTLQSRLLPRGDPIRSPCSLQLCRERQAPLRPIQRAARKRKRRRIDIPTRRQQPATRLVNRTHLVHGRWPNAAHGRPAHGLDDPRNRTITLDTTRLLALSFPTSRGEIASAVGASRMTRPLRKSRTTITTLLRPPVNDSISS